MGDNTKKTVEVTVGIYERKRKDKQFELKIGKRAYSMSIEDAKKIGYAITRTIETFEEEEEEEWDDEYM
jgi:hypothetical protein